MNDFYKNYITENADLIDLNKWDEFFFVEPDLQIEDLRKLINILDEANIDWRPHMTKLIYGYIPEDVEEYVIPDNIKEIDENAIPENIRFLTIPTSVIKIDNFAFDLAEIDELKYLGTKEQWKNMKRRVSWKGDGGIKSIYAADGRIK